MTDKSSLLRVISGSSSDDDHHQPDNSNLANHEMIQSILRDKEAGFIASFPFAFKFIFTDITGTILFSLDTVKPSGSKSSLAPLKVGANLMSDKRGTNAVSLSIERQDEVYVFGNEPFLQQRWLGWSGFALPLYSLHKDILGYFSLFAQLDQINIHSFSFIKMMASLIESEINTRMNNWGSVHYEDYIKKRLERFNLTPRERQVAALWMMDYEHKQIGEEIGISENTVRVMTTRLNSKLKVHSKASLILRVIGAIES